MRTPEQVRGILEGLAGEYPLADCTLNHTEAWELLVQVRLAAQCTDERVNKISPALFQRFPSAEVMAQATAEEVEPYIHSCGFYHGKARDIVGAAKMLVEDFGGVVPDNMEDLLKLPGMGRKSANLILGDVYHKPGSVVVDTHCIRLSNRLGLVDDMKEPAKIETALRAILPPEECSDFCHRIVYHGRAVCSARAPKCERCCVRDFCQTYETRNDE
ncbi:MAG: endonuclease III [Oscillospiraceae bacterium]|nr:endonuclease III [Oscillospiraceae bacterium]